MELQDQELREARIALENHVEQLRREMYKARDKADRSANPSQVQRYTNLRRRVLNSRAALQVIRGF